jgi:hypothetical protein
MAYARGAHDNLSVATIYLHDLPMASAIPDWAVEVEGKPAPTATPAPSA